MTSSKLTTLFFYYALVFSFIAFVYSLIICYPDENNRI